MKSKKTEIKTKNEETGLIGLANFFDLLAKFDYEDKQKEKEFKSPEVVVNDNSNSKPAVRTSGKTCSVETLRSI